MKDLPSQEYLQECFDYAPLTGELTWKTRPLSHFKDSRSCNNWNVRLAGGMVTYVDPTGYLHVGINNKDHRVHHLIWKLTHGVDPIFIDHINGDRADNRIANLREATHAQNNYNSKIRKHNRLGIKGVRITPKGRYTARIRHNNTALHIGTFDTKEEAHSAYCTAAHIYHGEYAHE